MIDDASGHAIERRIVLSYLPATARMRVHALLALDDRLGTIVAVARDPLIGQMRLAWWHDALCALDSAPSPAEPILKGIQAEVLPHGVSGRSLAQLVDGWEALLAVENDPDRMLTRYAADRGTILFLAGAALLGVSDSRLADIGQGWALAEAYRRTGRGRREALAQLSDLMAHRWPKELRALSAMALGARLDLTGAATAGSVTRAARLFRHRLTGR